MAKAKPKVKVEKYTSPYIHNTRFKPKNKLLIATPTTGTVRMEWVLSRYGQVIPTNWSMVSLCQYITTAAPIGYMVADAQNVCVKHFLDGDFEWLFFLEHDVMLPPDGFMRFNEYLRKADTPVVSGLYYTRSNPAEPLLYRGRGNSFYTDWKLGDKVWVDGVPTGCLMIHHSLLRTMWENSEEYMAGNVRTRKVFEEPNRMWFDPDSSTFMVEQGTSDLEWCSRIIRDDIFTKAGWPKFAKKKYPFLVDTQIFCRHIDITGEIYPV